MKILLFIGLAIAGLQIQAQQIVQSKIDKDDLKTIIKILSSDSLEGRGTGTSGQKRAEKFISNRYQNMGLLPFDQTGYLEKFKLTQRYWGEVYIMASNKRLANFDKVVFQGRDSQNTEVDKEVVFGGWGTEKELSQINVQDRLVLIFVKNLRANGDVRARLGKRKAYGVILANPENDNQFESIKKTFKDFSLQKRLSFTNDTLKAPDWDTLKFINSFTISNTEIKSITTVSKNKLLSLIAADDIKGAPISKVKMKCERIEKEIETANIIGMIKGTTDKTIVISAHYDHLGKSGENYFPGADDNASGVAGMLEIAEAFSSAKELKYNLLFVATSAEEAGLLGSNYHVNKLSFNPAAIVCNLNLDMIGRSDQQHSKNQYLYCMGTDQSSRMESLIRKVDASYDQCAFDFALNNSKDPMGLYTRSDQYNFYKKGILALAFFSGLHADYHHPTDTWEKIDYSNLEKRVRLIGLVIDQLETDGF